MTLPYHQIPTYPKTTAGSDILIRLIDSLGFRFYWSTECLKEELSSFKPAKNSMALIDLLQHISNLITKTISIFGFDKLHPIDKETTIESIREATLLNIEHLSSSFKTISDQKLFRIQESQPDFWNAISGPIADALTHIGQINTWRKLAGDQLLKPNYFRGLPPK